VRADMHLPSMSFQPKEGLHVASLQLDQIEQAYTMKEKKERTTTATTTTTPNLNWKLANTHRRDVTLELGDIATARRELGEERLHVLLA
jgi:hypothetical protein